MQRTICTNFIAPSDRDILAAAKKLDVSNIAPDIVRDICNLYAGGRVKTKGELHDDVVKLVDKDIASGEISADTLADYGKDIMIQQYMSREENALEFFDNIDFRQLPGATPLDKGLNMLKILQKMQQQDSSEGEPTRTATSLHFNKETAENLNIVNQIVNEGGCSESMLHNPNLDAIEQAAALMKVEGLSEIFKYANIFDGFKNKVITTSKLVKDSNGFLQLRNRPRSLDFGKLSAGDMVYKPHIITNNYLTGKLQVSNRYARKLEGKPFVTVLCDNSGSMSGTKQYKALGMIYNLLESCHKGELSLLFSFFERSCQEWFLFPQQHNPQDKFIHTIATDDFGGGGTEVGHCINSAINKIDEVIKLYDGLQKPNTKRHLIIINDGQDNVDMVKPEELAKRDIILHGFVLHNDNPAVRRICMATGGTYQSNL